ncbi:hypothetical protein KO489_05320 [Reinekea forsetii]|nr:hypothetical protein [Reinekea forsetii]
MDRTHTLLFVLMFGVFLSTNIIVLVHQLSHIEDLHEVEIIDCESFHADTTLALLPSSNDTHYPEFKMSFRRLSTLKVHF